MKGFYALTAAFLCMAGTANAVEETWKLHCRGDDRMECAVIARDANQEDPAVFVEVEFSFDKERNPTVLVMTPIPVPDTDDTKMSIGVDRNQLNVEFIPTMCFSGKCRAFATLTQREYDKIIFGKRFSVVYQISAGGGIAIFDLPLAGLRESMISARIIMFNDE